MVRSVPLARCLAVHILGIAGLAASSTLSFAGETVKSTTLPNGDVTVRIDQPVVNSAANQPHRAIQFQPGDRIQIRAGGCVQTGGVGDTWKRYANPSGSGSDAKYFGRYQIPGATAGFVRFSPSGQTLFIPKTFVPPVGDIFLTLRYEDDGYGDNGYWSHDNGNDDQCKQGANLDGGPAWIEITSHHDAQQILSGDPYDLLATDYDLNSLPLNPRWAPQFLSPPILAERQWQGGGRARYALAGTMHLAIADHRGYAFLVRRFASH